MDPNFLDPNFYNLIFFNLNFLYLIFLDWIFFWTLIFFEPNEFWVWKLFLWPKIFQPKVFRTERFLDLRCLELIKFIGTQEKCWTQDFIWLKFFWISIFYGNQWVLTLKQLNLVWFITQSDLTDAFNKNKNPFKGILCLSVSTPDLQKVIGILENASFKA